ncbi:uncharacterized protein [Littorina saxatilis]|uniref:Uncharacterized protein n=1 Tax=Littorina saxatilis TaxID=31220 RepID=A0AAN9FYC9_9CAEN
MAPGQFDRAVVTDQLKECCVVETTRQRKFGFAACIPHHKFVQRFRELAFSGSLSVSSVTEACKAILKKTELFDKGVTLSKTSVFLRYWHVNRLHALKADHLRRVIVAQAHVRGFLTRRRLRGRITSSQQRALIGQFMHDVSRAGDRAAKGVHDQADFDRRRFERELQGAGSRLHHPGSSYQREEREEYASHIVYDSHYGRRESGEYQLPGYMNDRDSPLVLDDTARFYKQVVDKVVSTLHTLEPSVWVKLIYMEKGRQVAKVYAEDKSIMIDGSHVDFDGERLGLGAWRNPDRDEETAYYRASVMEGVRLKRDQDGSISACRLCDQPIIVKGLEDPDGAGCYSADVLLCRGQLPYERTIKIFDIKEFRSKVALDIKQGRFSKSRMQRACVLGLSFGRDVPDDLETPCWMCVVNVKALAALDSDEIIREAEHETVKLEMTSPEEEIQKLVIDDVKSRHTRGRWARTDQRDHLQEKDKGDRHIRLQLRAKGLPVGEHVRYSWQHEKGGDKTTMDSLHEMVDSGFHAERSRGSGRVRDWAKVEVAVKDRKNRNMYDRSFSTTSTDDGRN